MAVYPWQQKATAPAVTAPATRPAAAAAVVAPKAAPATPPTLPPRSPSDSQAPLTIVKLTAENVKRLRAVEIKPDGALVVLGGRNAQGKTSILDAITWALGGKPDVAEPVRRGEGTAEIVCDLGDLIVRRRFTAGGGTTLEVTSREGLRYPSPQGILDDLVGRLTFDPLEFARMKPKEQRDTLQALVGIDTAADEAKAKAVYDERTAVNREIKAAQARLQTMPLIAGIPEALLSAGDIAAEMQRAQETNSRNAAARRERDAIKVRCDQARDRCTRLRDELALATTALEQATADLEQSLAIGAEMQDVDLAPFTKRLAEVDATNTKVRNNQQRREIAADLERKQAQAEALTGTLEQMAAAQAEAVAAAPMPIAGLGFGEVGVTLNGLPLEQGSGAEQLRVSVAIGLAMNPRLRVLLIRDASLLDSDSLRLVGELAAAAGAQVWMEMVADPTGTAIIIEDGMVQERGEKEGAA